MSTQTTRFGFQTHIAHTLSFVKRVKYAAIS